LALGHPPRPSWRKEKIKEGKRYVERSCHEGHGEGEGGGEKEKKRKKSDINSKLNERKRKKGLHNSI